MQSLQQGSTYLSVCCRGLGPGLEREAGRNVEVMCLTGRLVPDHKAIADFRKDNGRAIRQVCARFVALCSPMAPVRVENPQVPIATTIRHRAAAFSHDQDPYRTPRPRKVTQIDFGRFAANGPFR